jgi:hypothetical protein
MGHFNGNVTAELSVISTINDAEAAAAKDLALIEPLLKLVVQWGRVRFQEPIVVCRA